LLVLDIDANDLDYKTTTEINRSIAMNLKRHQEETRKRDQLRKFGLNAQEKALNRVRSAIKAEQQTIAQMIQDREDYQVKLAETEIMKNERIESLEKTHREVSAGVHEFVEPLREKQYEFKRQVLSTEAEVSGLSTKLARETEAFRAETRNLVNMEERKNSNYSKRKSCSFART